MPCCSGGSETTMWFRSFICIRYDKHLLLAMCLSSGKVFFLGGGINCSVYYYLTFIAFKRQAVPEMKVPCLLVTSSENTNPLMPS